MTTIDELRTLLQRVEVATGGEPRLDADICVALNHAPHAPSKPINLRVVSEGSEIWLDYETEQFEDDFCELIPWGDRVPALTSSIVAAVVLIENVLPGWWWKIGTCCVSDDACIAPDFNSPEHGARLHEQFPAIVKGSEFDAGFDVDRRPPGSVPLALMEAALRALIAIKEQEA